MNHENEAEDPAENVRFSHGSSDELLKLKAQDEAGRIARDYRESVQAGESPFHEADETYDQKRARRALNSWQKATTQFARKIFEEAWEQGYLQSAPPGVHRCDCLTCKYAQERHAREAWQAWYASRYAAVVTEAQREGEIS